MLCARNRANTISHVERYRGAPTFVPRFGNENRGRPSSRSIFSGGSSRYTRRAGSCLDDDCEDCGGVMSRNLQGWNPARARREESCPARSDALEDRLQGHRHHARANAWRF